MKIWVNAHDSTPGVYWFQRAEGEPIRVRNRGYPAEERFSSFRPNQMTEGFRLLSDVEAACVVLGISESADD